MWRKKNREEGVSAVIAVILMVAITVVLAGVLYVWVMNMAQTSGGTNVTIGLTSKGKSNNYYIWSVASVQGSAPITDVTVKVIRGGAAVLTADFSTTSPTDNTTYYEYKVTGVIILDNNHNEYLDEGDTLKVWDSTTCGGTGATTGDTLEIYVGGKRAASVPVS